MSRIYAQQKRPGAKAAAPSYDAPAVHAPSLVSGQSSSDLDAMMQAKYRQHFLDNQIPTAEAEADRIAASVSGARTPEEVKTQLGEKMGADFSNVTFHTDSAALKQADAMGARAYTSGSDVYFGSGGFDPGVAAHELVHTVQQGMVGSAMQTTSAPTGGVQMMPLSILKLQAKIRNWNDNRKRKRERRDANRRMTDSELYDTLFNEYNDWDFSPETPEPQMPDGADPNGNNKQKAQYAEYQRQLSAYQIALEKSDARRTKERNDYFGFRNHKWQFWRPDGTDFSNKKILRRARK